MRYIGCIRNTSRILGPTSISHRYYYTCTNSSSISRMRISLVSILNISQSCLPVILFSDTCMSRLVTNLVEYLRRIKILFSRRWQREVKEWPSLKVCRIWVWNSIEVVFRRVLYRNYKSSIRRSYMNSLIG